LRLLPYRYTSAGIRRVNGNERKPVCIYFHPWEIDANLPRMPLSFISRLRTYGGLGGMQRKIERLMQEFSFSTISAAYAADPVILTSGLAAPQAEESRAVAGR
jgi:hypothetical protein